MREVDYTDSAEIADLMKRKCAPDYIYRQLAEECTELAQAALKIVRMRNGEASHLKESDVMDNFIEEIADTSIMIDLVLENMNDEKIDAVCRWEDMKKNRMYKRLSAMPDNIEAKLCRVGLKRNESAAPFSDVCPCAKTEKELIQAVLSDLLFRI